ncbi:LysR family transcriptional regulator [Brevibacterium album]|uniref:LysR family transcriptional regulator n=1 Tax=Brevibacterium album TaxID=417948 RepID=UPI000417FE17|nr:LysR family transcriptional regulator [Brevibacterium album]
MSGSRDDALLPSELLYFREVAAADSVSEAARRLHVNASAVSRQIAKLERSLGVQLFVRRSRGVHLTTHGYRLLTHVRRAGVEARELFADLSRETDVVRRLAVACSDGFAGPVVAPAAAELSARHPGVRIDVTVASSEEVTRAVREERADVGACFVTGLAPGVRVEHVRRVPMYAVVAAGAGGARAEGGRAESTGDSDESAGEPAGDALTLDEALARPYALLLGQSSQRELLARAARERGVELDPVFECESSAALLDFARAGGGLVFLSPLGAGLRRDPELRLLRIADAELGLRTAQIQTPTGSQPDALQSELLSLMVDQLHGGPEVARTPRGAPAGAALRPRRRR